MEPLIAYVLSYLYGSIPFSYLLPKLLRGVDVTRAGTRNVGASNAGFATQSIWFFLICFLLDATKGVLPVMLFHDPVAGAFGVVGHIFSLFMIVLKFRLRKFVIGLGMSATIGWLLMNAWPMIPLALLFFVVFYLLTNPRKDLESWYEIEEGNIETVFAVGASAVTYMLLFNPNEQIKIAIAIIVTAVFIAYARRIREQLIEFWDWKKSEKYLKELKGIVKI